MSQSAFERRQYIDHIGVSATRIILLILGIFSVLPKVSSAASTIAFVQVNSAVPQGQNTQVAVTYTKAQTAGNLNVVVVGWNDSSAQVSSVRDSKGNAYTLAVGPTVQSGTATQAIYYAKNIVAAAAGGNTVTVAFNTGTHSPDIRIAEYSGVDATNPMDVVAAAQGSGTVSSSGSVTTASANDLLVGANLVQQLTSGPGSGYTSRVITSHDGDILEDEIASTAGSYSATAQLSGGAWIMQMVAFRAAGSGSGTAPNITSASSTTFTVGTAGSFTVTATGSPTPSLSESGTLPTGVTFTNNGNGTATLSGAPASGSAGNYSLTLTASNGVGTAASQVFTLTVGTSGGGGSAITLVQHGSLDSSGISATLAFNLNNSPGNWIGVVIRAGALNEVFTVTDSNNNTYHRAIQFNETGNSNTIGIIYAENIKGGANTIRVSDTASATLRFAILEYSGVATSNSLDVTATAQGDSVSPNSGNATTTANRDLLLGAIMTSDPASFTAGPGYKVEESVPAEPNTKLITEDQVQTIAGTDSASATLGGADFWAAGVAAFKAASSGGGGGGTAPSITSASSTTFTVGAAGTFTVTATGSPAPSLSESGTLPSGVTFANIGNGTATLSGTPGSGTAGTYSLTFTASNGIGTPATQSFTLTVASGSGPSFSFVQVNSAVPQGQNTQVAVTYTKAQTAGDLSVVVVGWNDSSAQVSSVRDSKGNVYALAVGPTVQSGTATQAIYYAKNIVAAAAGGNTVTVVFNTGANSPDIRIAEYSGVDATNPVDVVAAAQGSGTVSDSGSVTTGNANDLLVGANLVQQLTTGPGSGYTSRVITSPNGDLLEDEVVTTAGTHSATAQLNGGAWIMQMVAFRAAGSGSGDPPPTITSLSPTAGPVGTAVAISGTNFGSSQGTSTVTFNGANATVTAWTSGSITATVPSGATTGNVVVRVNGLASNGVNFTVTSGSISVTLSPKRAALTLSQSQQFTATVSNDPKNGGVTWSVDGTTGGNTSIGTISGAGLFAPGTQPGVHTVSAISNSDSSASASAMIAVTDLAGIFTYHNDNARTGQNLQEYALTPATVNSSTLGALFTCPVDGYVYAAPLYVANLNIGGQTRNVVFIATEHDSVYAFNADSPSCVQLWKTSFLSSGVSTVPAADTGELGDLVPEIGITSTPVIDPSTNTIYVVSKTKETVGTGCSTGNPCYVHRLHALDTTTGTEKFGGPVVLTAPNFVPLYHLQRPALLLSNGTLYIGFGSHGDNNTYQGWLMVYNAATLAQRWAWHATDPTNGNNEGAIWGSGNGPAADSNGNIYVETSNGVFDSANNLSDSVVKLSPTGTMLDYFTPFDQDVMQQNDIDLGSSGPMILPDSVGSSAHPHVMIASGKIGVVYLLDQTNLGKYNTAANQDLGEVNVGFNTTDFQGGFYGQPAYWNGNIYTVIVGDSLRQYRISNGAISTVSSSNSSNTFTFRGATPAVSASGTTNGILWVADITAYQSGGAVILDAYDATNVSTLLYRSPSSGSGGAAPAAKFTVPTVANGKVYVGGQFAFTVFGLLPN